MPSEGVLVWKSGDVYVRGSGGDALDKREEGGEEGVEEEDRGDKHDDGHGEERWGDSETVKALAVRMEMIMP